MSQYNDLDAALRERAARNAAAGNEEAAHQSFRKDFLQFLLDDVTPALEEIKERLRGFGHDSDIMTIDEDLKLQFVVKLDGATSNVFAFGVEEGLTVQGVPEGAQISVSYTAFDPENRNISYNPSVLAFNEEAGEKIKAIAIKYATEVIRG